MAPQRSPFQKILGWFGLIAISVAIWQHCDRLEGEAVANRRGTATVMDIYHPPGDKNRKNYKFNYSYYIDGEPYSNTEYIPVVAEGYIPNETMYAHLNGIPIIESMDLYINYNPEEPKYAKIIRDTFPEATLTLAQITLKDWLVPYHENPGALINFAYQRHGMKGLQTLFWVSRQEGQSLNSKAKEDWQQLQADFLLSNNPALN